MKWWLLGMLWQKEIGWSVNLPLDCMICWRRSRKWSNSKMWAPCFLAVGFIVIRVKHWRVWRVCLHTRVLLSNASVVLHWSLEDISVQRLWSLLEDNFLACAQSQWPCFGCSALWEFYVTWEEVKCKKCNGARQASWPRDWRDEGSKYPWALDNPGIVILAAAFKERTRV